MKVTLQAFDKANQVYVQQVEARLKLTYSQITSLQNQLQSSYITHTTGGLQILWTESSSAKHTAIRSQVAISDWFADKHRRISSLTILAKRLESWLQAYNTLHSAFDISMTANNNLVETNNNLVETNNELKELSQKELALQKEESQLRETLYRELLQITKEQNSLSFKLYDSGELTDEEMSTLVALRKRIREVKEFLNFSYKQS